MNTCRHKQEMTKCIKCFEQRFGKADKKGKRKGFNVIGQKTGGQW